MLYFPAVVRPQGLRIIKIQFKLILKTQNKFGLKITKKKRQHETHKFAQKF